MSFSAGHTTMFVQSDCTCGWYGPCRSNGSWQCVASTHVQVQVVHLKQCSSCAREIPESATVCDACSQWAADVVAQPSPFDARDHVSAPPSPSAAGSHGRRAGPNRRELLVILLAVAGSGIITLALLSARGAPSEVGGARGAAPAPSSSANPQPESGTQTWSTENRAYWVGNRPKSAAFELPAENTVSIWLRSVRPALIVRCMSQGIQVFVVTESAMKIEPQTENHTVTFGFDDEPTVTEQWPDSDEHDALFAPDGAGFAQRLIRARTLRFGYTPHNVDPVVAQFHVSGLGPLLEPVAKECGWKK